jgi:hypothetical protein
MSSKSIDPILTDLDSRLMSSVAAADDVATLSRARTKVLRQMAVATPTAKGASWPTRLLVSVAILVPVAAAATLAVTLLAGQHLRLITAPAGASPSPTRTVSPPVLTDAAIVAVAKQVVSPSGGLCDTHRDNAPSDVNACPYSDRLKARVNGQYQLAWAGQGNPNPVLSAGPPCGPAIPTVVAYFPATTTAGRIVSFVANCGTPAANASGAWQSLVFIAGPGSAPLVDDILRDLAHTGNFVSIYPPPPESFIGDWHVHGAGLKITSETAGVITADVGYCVPNDTAYKYRCTESDELTMSLSGDKNQLTATVTKITFTAADGTIVRHSVTQSSSVGDSFRLEFEAPQLLKETILHGMAGWVGGNPYWCGQNLAPELRSKCGA